MMVASIIIVNYNAGRDLEECISALEEHTSLPHEVIVVDNNSTDGSMDGLKERHPDVHIISSETNVGYACGINLGAAQARGEYLVIFNPDVIVKRNWLAPLVNFLREHPKVGAVTPRILLHENPFVLNALGQNIHFTGLGFNRKLNQPSSQADREPVRVSGVQGGAFVMPSGVFRQIGGMNESYFLYHEDVELSLRLALAGYHIYTVPGSVVSHKYHLHMTPDKLHWLERHRWMTLLTTYQASTLLVLTFLLLLTEAMMAGYCLLRGGAYLRAKAKAIQWVFVNLGRIRSIRKKTQSLRRVSDREAFSGLRFMYDYDQFISLVRQRGNCLMELVFPRSQDRTA
jgi:GT2 family glycosyltransferase